MTTRLMHRTLTYCIAAVWIVNGVFCKVINLVPRHEQIVARILGADFSRSLTIAIGCSELGMAIWMLSRIKTKLNAVAQITIVATMNMLEFMLAPDLLLWGKFNTLFAFLFVAVVYVNEFYFNKKLGQQT